MNVNELFIDDDFSFPEISEREMACERLIFNTTEDILLAMQDAGMKQSDLAKKLGKSDSYISQMLSGTRNITLRTLSDISTALGVEVKITITKDGVDVSHPKVSERKRYTSSSTPVVNGSKSTTTITLNLPDMNYFYAIKRTKTY
ncbi:helix-turn-helix domain-containing protein [Salmonella enterica subsp. enterica]|nr:helix-turn-helix domain-containing protein [Salmonella enterica subsp. enterica]ECI0975688.1 helix-turn-helix domain-containing protein [Salmonella enterica subsp. enterica serovar Newport]ECO0900727.1 helix-turn-helix domain-containing protein [Salmonella enterica subsp. enterica serovar Newport]EDQ2989958.1 helix-turn-helix domain-containing protein [Salmonella enterica subsp. enterica]EDT3088141.1 helix-turn-helix domain-containing protein [Salmonella enterica subsp. enterica serovar Newp